jgi:hypothetical protein
VKVYWNFLLLTRGCLLQFYLIDSPLAFGVAAKGCVANLSCQSSLPQYYIDLCFLGLVAGYLHRTQELPHYYKYYYYILVGNADELAISHVL